MRRVILIAIIALALLVTVNTVVTDNETKSAKADIGRVLDLPNGDLQVREEGSPNHPTIVMLHGLASSMHWWTPTADHLRRDFHIVRVDLLGHGGSEKPDSGYSMESQARRVAGALAQLGVRQAVIAGYSMGGIVATALAELNPRLVGGIVLVGAAERGRRQVSVHGATRVHADPRSGYSPNCDRRDGPRQLEKRLL